MRVWPIGMTRASAAYQPHHDVISPHCNSRVIAIPHGPFHLLEQKLSEFLYLSFCELVIICLCE